MIMGNEGTAYENYIYQKYKGLNMVPKGFIPAGPRSDGPDMVIVSPANRQALIELKVEGEKRDLDKLDYGQAAIRQNETTLQWEWSPFGSRLPSAQYLRSLLDREQIIQKINSHWKGLVSSYQTKGKTQKNYDLDRRVFSGAEGSFKISSTVPLEYYASKGNNYIQIKNRGTYLIGNDIYGLGVPRFIPNAVYCICRRKGRRFTTAIRVEGYPSTKVDMDNHRDLIERIIEREKNQLPSV